MYQVAEMGQALAQADPRARPADYFARQVRQIAMHGALVPERLAGTGRTSARLFGYDSLLKAKIVSALVDIGLPVEVQRLAVAALDSPEFQGHWSALRETCRSEARSNLFMCVLQSGTAGSGTPWQVDMLRQLENAAVFPLLGDYPVMVVLDLAALLRHMPDDPSTAA